MWEMNQWYKGSTTKVVIGERGILLSQASVNLNQGEMFIICIH